MTPASTSFILASASPRRQQLLSALGANFRAVAADVDESAGQGEDPSRLALRLAGAKAQAVARENPGMPVLAADTVVALGQRLLGKPVDPAENMMFLEALQGRPHQVVTGHVLLANGHRAEEAPVTTVTFRELAPAEIERYAATGEGLDKAGGYGLQGLGGALVERVDGCHTNVIGLSLPAVIRLFRQLEVPLA